VYKKNEWQQKLADTKQHALQCARERDQWSRELHKAREEKYLAELNDHKQQIEDLVAERDAALGQVQQINNLREQIADLAAERDAARQQVAAMAAERDAAREQAALVDELQAQLTALSAESAHARQTAAQVGNLKQQLTALASERDSARGQLRRVDALRQQLAETASQRDAARQQLAELEASRAAVTDRAPVAGRPIPVGEPETLTPPAAATPLRPLRPTATAAGVVLSIGILVCAMTFQDAQSTVQSERQSAAPAGEATAPLNTLDSSRASAARGRLAEQPNDPPPPQTKKPKTRFAKLDRSAQRQWGPPLLMQDPQATKTIHGFDPLVQQQQQNLLALGFDVGKADGFNGPRTDQALNEFKSLYLFSAGLKKPLGRAALTAITRNYADLARDDASNFDVDQGVVAAIRLSSVRTGIDFSYLMKLAAVESNFDPLSKAAGSSATGLYQFTRETWLNTVKAHGDQYGLQDYAAQIDYVIDADGNRRPVVRDKAVYEHLLELRTNPRVSAMMAAESVKDNLQKLTSSFDRTPSQADLYLTHFLGTDGAISFLRALDETPDALAVDMFPAAAQSNQDIFHPKTCRPRTVDEVYALFGRKFNTAQYDLATTN
jgi:uncharacterized coiled-coil DUF342 family protein